MKKDIKQSIIECAPKVLGAFPVLFAYLYGSYAIGTVHDFSDVDIAIFVSEIALDVADEMLGLESDVAMAFENDLGHMTSAMSIWLFLFPEFLCRRYNRAQSGLGRK